MNANRLAWAQRYAINFLKICAKKECVDQKLLECILDLQKFFAQRPDLFARLKEDGQTIVSQAVTKCFDNDPFFQNFFMQLFVFKDAQFFREVLCAIVDNFSSFSSLQIVYLQLACSVEQDLIDQVLAKFALDLKATLYPFITINPDLVAGFRLRHMHMLYDFSLVSRIKHLLS